ncbi:p23 chaperone protein wos2 [Neonectria magnoliae]|uniref:P23 chaperone protein wos2 n=1 Tax=Neonectria magnoliae TaxID=2732573 RepID=A0ABR1HJP1_9HYPO
MATTSFPEVLWAQRSSVADAEKNFVYVTITAPDVPKNDIKLDVKPTSITFTGTSSSLKKTFHVELELWGEIDPENSRINHTGKNVELKLQKKELKEEYWPRLLKEAKRVHFLKTDFDKWVDEDDQNEAADEDFSQFGNQPGAGMGGMPGMDGGDFGGIDFSKLAAGGAGGLPNMDALGGEDADEDEEEEEEDDMPALESVDASKPAAATPAAAATEPTASEKKA